MYFIVVMMCSAYCDPLKQDSQHLCVISWGSHNIFGISISEVDWCTLLQTVKDQTSTLIQYLVLNSYVWKMKWPLRWIPFIYLLFYLRETYIDSNMTRKLWGIKVDFMEPIKPFVKISQSCLQGSWQPCLVSKEGHLLATLGTLGYSADLKKRKMHPNPQAKFDGKSFAWLPSLERLLRV